MNKYEKRARRGAAVLDIAKPGWENNVNPWMIDLTSGSYCVIAQAYDYSFDHGVRHLRAKRLAPVTLGWVWATRRGFTTGPSAQQRQERAWRKLILDRRAARRAAEKIKVRPDHNLALSA